MFVSTSLCMLRSTTIIMLSIIVNAISIDDRSYYAYATASVTFPGFNFAAVGDWGCTDDTIDTVNNIIEKSPELVLGLGDYSYEDSPDCWFDVIQPISDKMKIEIGNHDVEELGKLPKYMNHFRLTEQYYSFDYRNIHFLALSTEVPFLVNSTQYNFV